MDGKEHALDVVHGLIYGYLLLLARYGWDSRLASAHPVSPDGGWGVEEAGTGGQVHERGVSAVISSLH